MKSIISILRYCVYKQSSRFLKFYLPWPQITSDLYQKQQGSFHFLTITHPYAWHELWPPIKTIRFFLSIRKVSILFILRYPVYKIFDPCWPDMTSHLHQKTTGLFLLIRWINILNIKSMHHFYLEIPCRLAVPTVFEVLPSATTDNIWPLPKQKGSFSDCSASTCRV